MKASEKCVSRLLQAIALADLNSLDSALALLKKLVSSIESVQSLDSEHSMQPMNGLKQAHQRFETGSQMVRNQKLRSQNVGWLNRTFKTHGVVNTF